MVVNLYPTQKKFVEKAIQTIESDGIGIFSSPTGTGKTISLLTAVLNFENKIYYTSRTHVQLLQAFKELKKISNESPYENFADDAVILGSRKIFCINTKINNLEPEEINERCRELIKNRECEFYSPQFGGSGEFFNIDFQIDDFFTKINDQNFIKNSESSTENKILKKNKIGILKEKIPEEKNEKVPFEKEISDKKSFNNEIKSSKPLIELHNCDFSIINSNSDHKFLDIEDYKKKGSKNGFCPYYSVKELSKNSKITFLPYQLLFSREGRKSANIELKDAIVIIDEAHNLYNTIISMNTSTLSSTDLRKFLREIKRCVTNLKNYEELICTSVIAILKFMAGKMESTILLSQFLIDTELHNINFIEISEHIRNTEVKNFFRLLTYSDDNCRVFYDNDKITITPMNPAIYLEDFDCKAILLSGGTMEPVDQVKSLFCKDVSYFSFPSICNDFKSFILDKGPSKRINLNFEQTTDEMLIECLTIINNLSIAVKTGSILCFFPSKRLLQMIRRLLQNFKVKKPVFFEDEVDFEKFKREKNSILFAVIGGKFSEGTDFRDDLCRLLIIVGVPFPTPTLELRYRNEAFPGYSTHVAMTAVNQTIGRAIRHQKDYAAIVLVDHRYRSLKRFISPHIQKVTENRDFPHILREIHRFLKIPR